MDAPNRLLEAAQEIQQFCRSRNWRFCFIGGFAVQRHAEPRVTRDIDVSVMTGLGNEGPVIDVLLAGFAAITLAGQGVRRRTRVSRRRRRR